MIVYGEDVVKWAERLIPGYGFTQPFGIGIIRQDKLGGAIILDNYRPAAKSICVSIAILDKMCLTRTVLAHVFDYAFNTLGCNRMNANIDVTNTPSLNLCRSLGFVHEGTLRKAAPSGNDLAVFGLLKDECRWLDYSKTISTS